MVVRQGSDDGRLGVCCLDIQTSQTFEAICVIFTFLHRQDLIKTAEIASAEVFGHLHDRVRATFPPVCTCHIVCLWADRLFVSARSPFARTLFQDGGPQNTGVQNGLTGPA